MKDYYGLLGIDTKASKAEVKKNYRKLVTKFHPDKNPEPDAAAKFIQITEAYEVLSDTKRRAYYDLMRWENKKRKEAAAQDYSIIRPPQESLRTRRRKAQQKRGIAFMDNASQAKSQFSIIKESFIVSSRFIFHFFGIWLLVTIIYSASSQLKDAFDTSIGVGVGTCLFLIALLYWTYWLGRLTYLDLKQDIQTFSVLFGITYRKAMLPTLMVIGMFLMILMAFIFR